MKRVILFIAAAITFMAFNASSCQKIDEPEKKEQDKDKPVVQPDSDETKANKYVRSEIMDVYYYWSDQVKGANAKLDAKNFNVSDFFDKMLYAKDRWSWMTDGESYMASETGVYTGTWGVSLKQPSKYYGSYALCIAYIYPGSPFEQFGVTRGAILKAIDGTDVSEGGRGFTRDKLDFFNENFYKSPQTFTFQLVDGRDTTFTASMSQTLSTRSYLALKIFDNEDFEGLNEKVGYFNYLTFNQNMTSDIDSAMTLFKREGVKKVIMDLRYNGGGSSVASDLLVNYLAPASANGEIYVNRSHNKLLRDNDFDVATSIKKDLSNDLGIEKIYYITGPGSASASEMVLNGLKPLTDIVHVGDTTYGKPNGMYVFYYPGDKASKKKYDAGDFSSLKYVYLPICFYNANGKGEFIPDEGMVPDQYVPDDLYHDFDASEANIKACLTHIVTGQFPSLPPKTKSDGRSGTRLLQEYEANPHYGTYTVKRPNL